jgi:hypothetical protein
MPLKPAAANHSYIIQEELAKEARGSSTQLQEFELSKQDLAISCATLLTSHTICIDHCTLYLSTI